MKKGWMDNKFYGWHRHLRLPFGKTMWRLELLCLEWEVFTWSQWHIVVCYLCYSSFWIWFYIWKTLNSHLCHFLLNIVLNFICFSTYFFDDITLCINLPNVTLSNMSHLVYITLFGETDGVTLSRLDCRMFRN